MRVSDAYELDEDPNYGYELTGDECILRKFPKTAIKLFKNGNCLIFLQFLGSFRDLLYSRFCPKAYST